MLKRRRIAGLIALCALVLSYSEALGAAACSMGMDMEMAADMPMPMPADEGDSDAPQPDCPLTIPGSPTNCIFSVAVLSTAPNKLVHAGIIPVVNTTAEQHYQLLLSHTAFHPPKA